MGRSWVVWLCAVWLVGCGAEDDRATLRVFAASSLTEAFVEAEAAFEQRHPDVDVVLSTAGSQTLRLQIEQGARADVFASANGQHMEALVGGGHALEDRVFARSDLVIVVPEANPTGLRDFGDLARAERLVIGAPEVPIGRYTRRLFSGLDGPTRERIEARVVSREPSVRLVLAKVEIGAADAAVVYRSDVAAGRAVGVIEIPEAKGVEATYHTAVLTRAPEPVWARRWVSFITSAQGRALLEGHGFEAE